MSQKIAHVYVFKNGMAMVFDTIGEQIPDYQGRWSEVEDKIREAADEKTIFHMSATWNRDR